MLLNIIPKCASLCPWTSPFAVFESLFSLHSNHFSLIWITPFWILESLLSLYVRADVPLGWCKRPESNFLFLSLQLAIHCWHCYPTIKNLLFFFYFGVTERQLVLHRRHQKATALNASIKWLQFLPPPPPPQMPSELWRPWSDCRPSWRSAARPRRGRSCPCWGPSCRAPSSTTSSACSRRSAGQRPRCGPGACTLSEPVRGGARERFPKNVRRWEQTGWVISLPQLIAKALRKKERGRKWRGRGGSGSSQGGFFSFLFFFCGT